MLQYVAERQTFDKIHQETFGRSGCRRTVPGQYVTADPRGRALMIAAADRQKYIYVMNRDPANAKLTISSPLEAHKASTLVFAAAGVDVGYENPIFACLELEYGELDDALVEGRVEAAAALPANMTLTFYEVDLGLNHATRKWLESVPETAHHLVTVPGGADGPGGILVCSENLVSWHNQGAEAVHVAYPSRQASSGKGLIVSCSSLVRAKNVFFFLLQTEEGDLFKLSIQYTADGVQSLSMRFFDTVGVASSMAVLKSGFLFVPGECMNHMVYQIQSLGDHEDEPEYTGTAAAPPPYMPRPLRNLAATDQMENYAPTTTAKLLGLGHAETPQLYACQGTGSLSSLNVVRYGLGVTEVAASELPSEPTGVWTLKHAPKDAHDAYLILAFADSTTVLSVGESIEEVADSGFLGGVATLAAFQLATEAYVQVHAQGVRQVSTARGHSEWKCPAGTHIVHAAGNERQLAVYLASRSIVYFELDAHGSLAEKHSISDLPEEISAMAVGPVPHERQRSRFLAVGSVENVTRVISLDPEDCLEPVSLQALAARPVALVLAPDAEGGLALEVGLQNGVLVTLKVDAVSGALSDARTRYVGSDPVRLVPVRTEGRPALLALSSRPWLKYSHQASLHTSPLFHEVFSKAAPFASEQCPSGIVAIVGSALRIITVESLGNLFTRQRVPLGATPRKLAHHAGLNLFALAESDREGMRPEHLQQVAAELQRSPQELAEAGVSFRSAAWAAAVEIFDPAKGEVVARLQLEPDESCQSVAFVSFLDSPAETLLAVGVSRGFTSAPRAAESSSIDLYRLGKGGALELVHKTPLEHIPAVMVPFAGQLLVGAGSQLRLYDMGRKRMLRKCEAKFPSFVVALQTQGWRIVVGDAHESVSIVQYRPEENQFVTFADEPQPRSISTLCMLDYDTVVAADRFGTVCVLRLPAAVSEAVDTDGTVLSSKQDTLFGAGNKLEKHAEYYLGDTIVSLHKSALVYGSREAIHYTTVSGAIGILLPFTSRTDTLLLQNLELFMRTEAPAQVAGREHLAYRSSYAPVKAVIDGNLCEAFLRLPADRKHAAAQALDATPEDIAGKVTAMRAALGF